MTADEEAFMASETERPLGLGAWEEVYFGLFCKDDLQRQFGRPPPYQNLVTLVTKLWSYLNFTKSNLANVLAFCI